MTEKVYDVIIIGGGPAGLSAAQYTARANLDTVILDKSPDAGALAYSSKIENYPGLEEPVSGKELLDRFRKQAVKFGARYVETQVVGVDFSSSVKEVHAIDGTYRGKTVIIATGSMGRKPGIPGEERLLGRGVSYCATCDAAFYRGLTVCVVGDSAEALKEADVLTEFAKTVYLIAPSKLTGLTDDHPLMSRGNVYTIREHRVISIEGDDLVKGIRIKDIKTGEERDLATDGVFVYLFGSQPVVDFLQSSMDMSKQECLMTHDRAETSIPGVYAAGDVTCGEVRQVVIAAACGCRAALAAEKFIRQRKRIKFDWAKS